MKKIAICICTFKREFGLKRLLISIEKLIVPSEVDVKVIVVENDSQPNSEEIVNYFSNRGTIKIDYFLETNRGIASARNRSIKEAQGVDFYCFVDDDQIVDSNWLYELLKCQIEFNADGVWGLCPPIFSQKVPSYINYFHEPRSFHYGDLVEDAGTGCLLLRKSVLENIIGPFDLRLNFTGGEDYHLIKIIIKNGGSIRFNPKAIAYELVPNSRTTILFALKRTFRKANTGYFINSFSLHGFSKNRELPRLFLRFFYGLIILLPFLIVAKKNKIKGLLKLVSAVGGVLGLYGKINRFYA